MNTRLQSAASTLVCLILSFLLFGGAISPAHAFPWGPGALGVSPDGRRVYVANQSGRFSVIDALTLQVTATIDLIRQPAGPG